MRETRETQHPDLDRWVAYYEGELPDDETKRLHAHLVKCPECVSLILDLHAFVESEKEDGAVPSGGDTALSEGTAGEDTVLSEFERAAAWKSMKAALDRHRRPERRGTALLAWAACLLVGVLGLALWTTEHRKLRAVNERLEQSSEPQRNVPIHDLVPNRLTRSGGTPDPVEIRSDGFTTLVLLPSETFESYTVEILDSELRCVWSGPGFVAHPELGTLTLGLPAGYLEPGEYTIRLYGGDEKEAVDEDLAIRVLP